MSIPVTCTCGAKHRVGDAFGGKRIKCPGCGQALKIPNQRPAHDVFICHSAKDKPIADATCASLEGQGIRCWIAPRDILPGREYGEAIIDGLSGCSLMVLVFSANANASRQVMREVERADSKGIPVIPLRIEDVPLAKSMEYFLSSPQWLDATTPPLEDHFPRLGETVGLVLKKQGRKAHRRTATTVPEPGAVVTSPGGHVVPPGGWRPPLWAWIVGGAAVLLLAFFATLAYVSSNGDVPPTSLADAPPPSSTAVTAQDGPAAEPSSPAPIRDQPKTGGNALTSPSAATPPPSEAKSVRPGAGAESNAQGNASRASEPTPPPKKSPNAVKAAEQSPFVGTWKVDAQLTDVAPLIIPLAKEQGIPEAQLRAYMKSPEGKEMIPALLDDYFRDTRLTIRPVPMFSILFSIESTGVPGQKPARGTCRLKPGSRRLEIGNDVLELRSDGRLDFWEKQNPALVFVFERKTDTPPNSGSTNSDGTMVGPPPSTGDRASKPPLLKALTVSVKSALSPTGKKNKGYYRITIRNSSKNDIEDAYFELYGKRKEKAKSEDGGKGSLHRQRHRISNVPARKSAHKTVRWKGVGRPKCRIVSVGKPPPDD